MTKKVGRPKKERRQEKHIGFYVTTRQYFVIQQKAAKARVNMSDYMRQAGVNAYVKEKWTEEEREQVRRIVAQSADIHQLVEIAGKEGALQAVLIFTKYREVLDSTLKFFRDDR